MCWMFHGFACIGIWGRRWDVNQCFEVKVLNEGVCCELSLWRASLRGASVSEPKAVLEIAPPSQTSAGEPSC